tara:strand:+ start:15036 stop:15455 length:420 start_codon:yes stop_codon:yes gene_type:complete
LIYKPLHKRKLNAEINVVPYIDVMLVLLIIFMILSPLLIQGVDVNLPKTDTTKMSLESEPMVISINAGGQYFINLGDESLPISLFDLKQKVLVIFEANPDIEVVIKSDSSVQFDYVAKAIASIQSVGVERVGIITTGYE